MKIWTKINFLVRNIFFWGWACALHGKNLARKLEILKIFLILLTITLVSICTSKKISKFFIFLAKFLNLLEGPPIEFFLNRFFSTTMHSQTKFHIVSGWVLTFGLDPLPRELWKHLVIYIRINLRINIFDFRRKTI